MKKKTSLDARVPQRTLRRLKESSSLALSSLSALAASLASLIPALLSLFLISFFERGTFLISSPSVMATTAPAPRRASLGAAAAAAAARTNASADADAAPPFSSESSSDLAFQTAMVLEWLAERSAGSNNADALVAALAEAKVKGQTRGRERRRERERK